MIVVDIYDTHNWQDHENKTVYLFGIYCNMIGFERSEFAVARTAGRHFIDIWAHSVHSGEEDPQIDGALR